MEAERHKLESTTYTVDARGREVYVHLLAGSFTIPTYMANVDPVEFRRDSLWDGPSAGLFVSGVVVDIKIDVWADLIIASEEVEETLDRAQIVRPARHVIGEGHTRRTVHEILGAGGYSQSLRFGETYNDPGAWSSYPPHSFDAKPELASKFQEKFFYFMSPRHGWALQVLDGVYSDGKRVNETVRVTSGSQLMIPLGRHPLVGGPDTKVMYVWAYVSPESKIYSRWAEDVGSYE
jgi:5-deoxy-glucuronate isomerase